MFDMLSVSDDGAAALPQLQRLASLVVRDDSGRTAEAHDLGSSFSHAALLRRMPQLRFFDCHKLVSLSPAF